MRASRRIATADAAQSWRIPLQLPPPRRSSPHLDSVWGRTLPGSSRLGQSALQQRQACPAWEALEGASLAAVARALLREARAEVYCQKADEASWGEADGALWGKAGGASWVTKGACLRLRGCSGCATWQWMRQLHDRTHLPWVNEALHPGTTAQTLPLPSCRHNIRHPKANEATAQLHTN